jgi:uncharacterized protein (DUF1800 family)
MSFQRTQQLFARFGFGMTPAEYHRWRKGRFEDALDDLFKGARRCTDMALPDPGPATMMDGEMEQKPLYMAGPQWMRRMADPTASPLLEKMTLFWHGHFACEPRAPFLAVAYCNTLRKNALGSFRELLLAVAKDASMIRYLNNQQNRKNSPNENFARELLELFTLGHGHYSETDIKEVARAFTGWSSTKGGEFVFREKLHDDGEKTFLGRTGKWKGEDIVDILLEKKRTAEFLTFKLWRFFVGETPDPVAVAELSGKFYASGYDIGRLVRDLAEHPALQRPENVGDHIKSPVELIVGLMRNAGFGFPDDQSLLFLQRAFGQVLFAPPNVAGWPGGKNWIDNSSLLQRLNLGAALCLASGLDIRIKEEFESPGASPQLKRVEASVDLSVLRGLLSPYPTETPEEVMADFFLPDAKAVRWDALRPVIDRETDPERRLILTVIGFMSLPEFQLT